MRRWLAIALLVAAPALAVAQPLQNFIVPTAPVGTSNNQAASTAFVQAAVISPLNTPNTWTALQTFNAGIGQSIALSGASGLGNSNSFIITADTQQCVFCTHIFSQWSYGGATARGSRNNFFGWNIQTAPNTGAGSTASVGGTFVGQTNTGESGGTWFGANTVVRATGSGLNAFSLEADYQTTGTWGGSYGAAVTATNFAAHQATVVDAGFLVYSGGLIGTAGGGGPWGPGVGFHCGLCFAELSSNTLVPIDSAGTLIGSVWTSISAPTVALGIDFGNGSSTGFNFSTGAFRSKGFLVDGSGNLSATAQSIGGAAFNSLHGISGTTAQKPYTIYTNTTNTRSGFVGVVDAFNIGINSGPGAAIVFQNNTTTVATITNGLQLGSPTGGDKGVGTINFSSTLWTNGTQGIALTTCTITAGNTLTFTNGILTTKGANCT